MKMNYVAVAILGMILIGLPTSFVWANPFLEPSLAQSANPTVDFPTVTPREDGALIHIVAPNQSLIEIAIAYDIPVNDLLVNNNLSLDAIIYVGDSIVIVPGVTPTSTRTPTSPPPTLSATPTVTVYRPSPTPRPSFTPRPSITISPSPTVAVSTSHQNTVLLIGMVALAFSLLLGVLIFGLFSGRRKG